MERSEKIGKNIILSFWIILAAIDLFGTTLSLLLKDGIVVDLTSIGLISVYQGHEEVTNFAFIRFMIHTFIYWQIFRGIKSFSSMSKLWQ